uniref:Beta-2 adrenergic receptor n=1 Tax=Eptatretus burgeri TaxID=7764 RepID=A0A8C4QLC8_EPTBU
MTSGNSTCIHEMTTHGSLTVAVILSILVFMTIAGNILALVAAATSERLKQKKSTAFIVSLSCADLIMGAVIMPFCISITYIDKWPFGRQVCNFRIIMDVTSVTASINSLCVIAIDRYIAITRPLRYPSLVTRCRATCAVLAVWILSITMTFFPVQFNWYRSKSPEALVCYENPNCCSFEPSKEYAVISSIISFHLPAALMIFVYSQVLKEATRQVRMCVRGAEKNQIRHIISAKERRALKTLSLIMGVFLFCWLPFFIINPTQALCGFCLDGFYNLVFLWLGYINSIFNPLLYSRNPEFMAAYRRLLCCDAGKLRFIYLYTVSKYVVYIIDLCC